ncbi:MAG TPA: exodeoxyribonuclease VII large subunit [Dermatophilaceae bacterium]|nr:exodeoxyribonuclease VII large subunit [Dermatophilaceae bacterium]
MRRLRRPVPFARLRHTVPVTVREPLPAKAADTSAERPWPVRLLAMKIGQYVDRMSAIWVEGQLVQVVRRPGSATCYLTLRDPDVDMSMSVTIAARALDAQPVPLADGARVVVHAKPTFWAKRGTLQLDARSIRAVGVGELMARLEHLKRVLAAEGLFRPERKRPLPFLPHTIGLICGRASAAEHDVVQNARRRHPAARFVIRQVPVQGPEAVGALVTALRQLDALTDVDVIVVARGGGSFEDLLPFSNEALVRAVAAMNTPVVSAIGHDVDTPLLDFVADVRASTPTDAAKRVVPDVAAEQRGVAAARDRVRQAVMAKVRTERRLLDSLRSRPVLADPAALVQPQRDLVRLARQRSGRAIATHLDRERARLRHATLQLRALSPLGILERGYAVVRQVDGRVVRGRGEVTADELLRVTVSNGDFEVRAVG